ncbi:MAG: cytidine deaminase [Kiritimatiellia bacterium]
MREREVLNLLEKARAVGEAAYSPYSGLRVGAALLAEDGQIFCGCNVENASYGITLCAERAALASAIAAGVRRFRALAVVAQSAELAYPCGTCRQALKEFCEDRLPIYVARASRLSRFERVGLGQLLPKAFRFRRQ